MVRTSPSNPARGFTITEMLVTVGVIVVLAGILVLSLSAASRAAQKGKTDFLMQSIKSGVERFRADHGYLPPVLGANGTNPGAPGDGRDRRPLPGAPGAMNGWDSMTSLPEFLLGYDDRRMDGYGYVALSSPIPPDQAEPGNREFPGIGFRSPGPDGVWNATLNPRGGGDPYRFISRNPGNLGNLTFGNAAEIPGKVYGPYIDLKDDSVIGEITGLEFEDDGGFVTQRFERVLLPGDEGFGLGDNPKVFVDYWGNPIRYYRRAYNQISDPSGDRTDLNLGQVIALRPEEFAEGDGVDSGYLDGNDDPFTSRALLSAEYALFSAGADKLNYDNVRRVDNDDEYNKDNIVKVGP